MLIIMKILSPISNLLGFLNKIKQFKNRLFKDNFLSPMILRLNKINNESCQSYWK